MITPERYRQIAFQAIQLLRQTERKRKPDANWKDIDDYIFSEMDLERGEVNEIFGMDKYPNATVYTGSCYPDGTSPKNFDETYFSKT